MRMRKKQRLYIFPFVLITILLAGSLLFFSGCQPAPPANAPVINLSEAIALSKSGNISSAVLETANGWMTLTAAISGAPLQINGSSGNPVTVNDGTQLVAYTDSLTISELQQMGFVLPATYSADLPSANQSSSSWLGFLPLVFLGLLLFLLLRSGSNQARSQLGDIGRSRARLKTGSTPSVTFADVAGVEEAKQDLQEVVDFLKNRTKFQSLGARIPKGILLVGPPGTGKTLIARAVAGEAGVPFFSISGSEFVEVFVGVGAARVRDLFMQAKNNRPSIIFIDEIDAVGRRRSIGVGGSHEEREQTLNQILTEMDGFTPNSGVIVIAATNRPDVLDPALLRPGRFDRRVVLDPPDVTGRQAILQVHSVGKPLDSTVRLDIIAKETHGFSGADLANLVNEAAILAARRNKSVIGMEEFEEAIDRVIAGPQRKSRAVSLQDKRTAAYHEAGHALVARMLPNADPVHKISIVARGRMGGYTRLLPVEERYLMTKSQLKDTIATFLAGHTAEEVMFKEVSTGPHSDIKQATEIARKMITEWGMGDKLSLRNFGGNEEEQAYYGMQQKGYGEDISKKIDEEVDNVMDEAHNTARKILLEYKPRLIHIAETLIAAETLEGEKLEEVFAEPISEPQQIKEEKSFQQAQKQAEKVNQEELKQAEKKAKAEKKQTEKGDAARVIA